MFIIFIYSHRDWWSLLYGWATVLLGLHIRYWGVLWCGQEGCVSPVLQTCRPAALQTCRSVIVWEGESGSHVGPGLRLRLRLGVSPGDRQPPGGQEADRKLAAVGTAVASVSSLSVWVWARYLTTIITARLGLQCETQHHEPACSQPHRSLNTASDLKTSVLRARHILRFVRERKCYKTLTDCELWSETEKYFIHRARCRASTCRFPPPGTRPRHPNLPPPLRRLEAEVEAQTRRQKTSPDLGPSPGLPTRASAVFSAGSRTGKLEHLHLKQLWQTTWTFWTKGLLNSEHFTYYYYVILILSGLRNPHSLRIV